MRRFAIVALVWLILGAGGWAQSLEDVLKRIQLLEMALEIGNHRAAEIALAQLEPEQLSDETLVELFKQAELGPEMVPVFRLETQLARLTMLEMSGQHSLVLSQGEKLLKQASTKPEHELHLRLLLLQAGRKGAFPRAVQAHLERAHAQAQKVDNAFGQFSRYLTSTYLFEQQSENLTSQQVLAQAQEAHKLWEALPLGTDDLASRQWHWGLEAVGVWREALILRMDKDPAIEPFLKSQEQALAQRARREYDAYRQTFDVNIAYLLALAEETLHDSRRFAALGQQDRAAQRFSRANSMDPGIFHDKMTNRALRLGWKEEGAFPFTQFSEFYLAYGLYEWGESRGKTGADLVEGLEAAALQFQKANNRAAEVDFLVEASQDLLTRRPPSWEEKVRAWNERSLRLAEELRYRPGRILRRLNLAEVLLAQNQPGPAMKRRQAAADEVEQYVTEAGTRHHLHRRFQRVYDLMTEIELKQGQGEKALEAQLRARQVEQLGSSQVQQALPAQGALAEAADANRQARARLRASESSAGSGESLAPRAQARSEFYQSLARIKEINPRYADFLAVRPINFARIRSSIPSDTALIVLAPQEEKTLIFVLSDKLTVRESAVGYSALSKHVSKFRRAIRRSAGGKNLDRVNDSLQQLYAALIEPIEAEIEGKKVLAFVPTRSLLYLPLQALARPKGERVEYLAERFQVATILKDSDLDGLRQPQARVSGPLVAFGNPDGTLPAAAREATEIGALFPQSTVFLQDKASEHQLASVQDKVSLLHMATHGTLDNRSPQSSYLVMAGSGPASKLTLSEVYGLDLGQVTLVTLSACQTSVGEANPGSEVSSLAAAFTIASASSQRSPTVVASLWSVDDEATAALMLEFYQRLKAGSGKAEALRQAQLKLLGTEKTRHPYFWAPFVLIGDWR